MNKDFKHRWGYNNELIQGVEKMRWDSMWHVVYMHPNLDGRNAYDRITKKTAMRILKMFS